jgi:hypothetical protein
MGMDGEKPRDVEAQPVRSVPTCHDQLVAPPPSVLGRAFLHQTSLEIGLSAVGKMSPQPSQLTPLVEMSVSLPWQLPTQTAV